MKALTRKDVNYIQIDFCIFIQKLYRSILVYIIKLYNIDNEKFQYLSRIFNSKTNAVVINNCSIKQMEQNLYKKSIDAKCIDLNEKGIFYIENRFNIKYIANSTALAIWDLLDGQRTAQQITQEIANVCEVEFETIKDDIYGQLAAFQELGLVEEVPSASHA